MREQGQEWMKMKNINQVFAAPNMVCICVDYVTDGKIEGRLYHYYAEEPEMVKDMIQLLQCLEQFYDKIDFPQAAEPLRKFLGNAKESRKGKELPKPVTGREFLMKQRGTQATFLLHVQYRQNATWQGQIMWKEKTKILKFCSDLELLGILDNALNINQELE